MKEKGKQIDASAQVSPTPAFNTRMKIIKGHDDRIHMMRTLEKICRSTGDANKRKCTRFD